MSETSRWSFWGFVRRHRLKVVLLVGGAACCYVYFSLREKYNYVNRMLEEERVNGAQRMQHSFGMSLSQAQEVLHKMLAEVRTAVFRSADADQLVLQLREPSLKAEERREKWQQLKTVSFLRSVLCVYTLCLLELVLVIKFNLVGRYISSSATVDELPGGLLLQRTQQSFVAMARHVLLGTSLDDLAAAVQGAVEDTLRDVPMGRRTTAKDVNLWIMQTRQRVEASTLATLRRILVDSANMREMNLEGWGDGDNIAALLAEEADILEGNDAATVLSDLLDRGFSSLSQLVDDAFEEQSVPLPKALPKVSNLAQSVVKEDSEPLKAIESSGLLVQFAAVVYLSGELPNTHRSQAPGAH